MVLKMLRSVDAVSKRTRNGAGRIVPKIRIRNVKHALVLSIRLIFRKKLLKNQLHTYGFERLKGNFKRVPVELHVSLVAAH